MTDYIEPYNQRVQNAIAPTSNTVFLDSFFQTASPQVTPKY